MGGVNGSLLRRLELVEERAPRPPAPVERVATENSFWERVFEVAPEPVWQYFCQVDAECAAENSYYGNTSFDADAWLKRHHPAFDDVLEGLARAVRAPVREAVRTAYVQGYTIQWASARLGMVYATERPGAGVTTSIVVDRQVLERASFDLLGWTNRECNQHWAQPTDFLEQWRSNLYAGVNISADTLARAGLHAAELELLSARGDTETNHHRGESFAEGER